MSSGRRARAQALLDRNEWIGIIPRHVLCRELRAWFCSYASSLTNVPCIKTSVTGKTVCFSFLHRNCSKVLIYSRTYNRYSLFRPALWFNARNYNVLLPRESTQGKQGQLFVSRFNSWMKQSHILFVFLARLQGHTRMVTQIHSIFKHCIVEKCWFLVSSSLNSGYMKDAKLRDYWLNRETPKSWKGDSLFE